MKTRSILSVSAIALLAAGAPHKVAEAESHDPIQIDAWTYDEVYKGWSAEEFIEAEVYDTDGEDIGEVEDMIIGPDGKIQKLVIEAGGFLDLGDTHFAMPLDQVTLASMDRVEVDFDEDNIESYSLFGDIDSEPAQGRNWRVSELIDDYARLRGGLYYGWVDDVIFNQSGEIAALVVDRDLTHGAGRRDAWPYYGQGYDPGLDFYEAPYGEEEVSQLDNFDYDLMTNEGEVLSDMIVR